MEATNENEELRRFREDWKREVATRKRADTVLSSASVSSSTVPRPESDLPPSEISQTHEDQPRLWPSKLASAVEMYSEAAALEENGLLDAATQLYKRAFAVDSNVHKAYSRAVNSTHDQHQAEQSTAQDLARRVAGLNLTPTQTSGLAEAEREDDKPLRVKRDGRSSIAPAHLALSDAKALSFMPPPRLPASSDAPAQEQPTVPTDPSVLNALTPIRKLPDELLIHILLFLIESPNSPRHHHHSHPQFNSNAVTVPELNEEDDNWIAAPRLKMIAASHAATNIERFARVCWKARILTLDAGIWRVLVHSTYIPPQVPVLPTYSAQSLLNAYDGDCRRMFVEQPRVRVDGVYIAVCHYVRTGYSENAWVNVTHLITYHRYLRFMPNGVVLSLLANEDQSPHDVVHNLKPGLKMKGFSTGTWTLDPSTSTVHVRSLIDPSKPPLPPPAPAPPVPLHVLLPNHPAHNPAPPPPPGTLRYSFDMELKLRSRPMGRWNRLDFVRYESVDLFQAGERCDVPLKNERSFWFSKVRRYSDEVED